MGIDFRRVEVSIRHVKLFIRTVGDYIRLAGIDFRVLRVFIPSVRAFIRRVGDDLRVVGDDFRRVRIDFRGVGDSIRVLSVQFRLAEIVNPLTANTFRLPLVLQNSSLAADGPAHLLVYEERIEVLLRTALLLNPCAATIA